TGLSDRIPATHAIITAAPRRADREPDNVRPPALTTSTAVAQRGAVPATSAHAPAAAPSRHASPRWLGCAARPLARTPVSSSSSPATTLAAAPVANARANHERTRAPGPTTTTA